MGFFTHWGRPSKKDEPDRPKYRIVKEEWPSGKVKYWIEEWTSHYACEENIWLTVAFPGFIPNSFDTLEEARKMLDSLLLPVPEPITTVVEER
jgi:hypothetical protein